MKGYFNTLKRLYSKRSSERYIAYLRNKGMRIGRNTVILSPNHSHIDEGRASWISIGDNCVLTYGVSIIAHDYSWSVLRKSHNVIAPTGGGEIKIGNNVFIGVNSLVLRNSSIGDNCIIGAGSIVCSSIPSNSVATGNPAKVIMSLDDYCEKRKKSILKEAINEVRHFYEVNSRYPIESEMIRFGFLFSCKDMVLLNSISTIGDDHDSFINTYLNQKSQFNNYSEFLEYAKALIN